MTVKEIFEKMPDSFQKDAAAGMNAVIQFDITGDGGGKYYAAIENGELTIAEGEKENPSMTLTASAQDYIDISTGKLNPQMAFMSGKLKVKGDMGLAMKMPTLFKQ